MMIYRNAYKAVLVAMTALLYIYGFEFNHVH